MSNKILFLLIGISCGSAASGSGVDTDRGFRPIFDGRSLNGWSAQDMRYWSVADGAITGESSEELPCRQNQFLVWQLGELDDFELKLKFRILGEPSANSGIQFRSQIAADGHAKGYQADIDRAGKWLGVLYDEHSGRGLLAQRGQRTVITAAGERTTTALPIKQPEIDLGEWNEYRIRGCGPQLTLKINGVMTAEVVDNEVAHRDLWGKLALQIHSGPSMKVQFKDIRLKRLPLCEQRKKIVLVAGAPSHASGEHEFNAGVKLLLRRLQKIDSVVAASYHDGGWPQDPTAMQNADAIVVYADGLGAHPLREHFQEVDDLMRKGVGLMCMHFAVHVEPGVEGDSFKRWIGGHYESGFSTNPHWTADLQPNPAHPVTTQKKSSAINDEWYFSIRFSEDEDVTPLLEAVPGFQARSMNGYPRVAYPHIKRAAGQAEKLMWGLDRPGGGRGVGFTGGHWHHNWAHDLQRNTVLAAMLWVAGAEVPEAGIESAAVSETELNEHLDPKQEMIRVELPTPLERPTLPVESR
jgi:hypothetical protein